MHTLEQTLADQWNLDKLCNYDPLQSSEYREAFVPNSFYGNDLIYKVYAGIPDNHNLKIVIPHGPTTINNKVWNKELEVSLPSIACFSSEDLTRYKKAIHIAHAQSVKNLESFASPFLYVREILKKLIKRKPKKNGTIFFPSHSTPEVTDLSDFSEIAHQLDQMRAYYNIDPIRVCIYWQDFFNGHHIPFLERGMQIISAGHAMNPLFLFRLFHLCSMHKYACSNQLGTSVPYAVIAGCTHFGIPGIDFLKPVPVKGSDHTSYIDVSENLNLGSKTRMLWECCFQAPDQVKSDDQQALARNCLGESFVKSPRDLRMQIMSIEERFYNSCSQASAPGDILDNYLYDLSVNIIRDKIKNDPRGYQAYLRLGFIFDSLGMAQFARRAWKLAKDYS